MCRLIETRRIAAVIAAAATVLSGCSTPSTNSGSAQAPSAAQANQNGVGSQSAEAAFEPGELRQWAGQVGRDGSTVVVSTATEALTVKTIPDTRMRKTTAGSLSDIQSGGTIGSAGRRAPMAP